MLKNLSNQKGISLVVVIIIVIIILIGILLLKMLTSNKNNTNHIITEYTNDDVYSWLDDIENLSNVYCEEALSEGYNVTYTKRYIKDSLKKTIPTDKNGKNITTRVMVDDISNNIITYYDEDTRKGNESNIRPRNDGHIYVNLNLYFFSDLKDDPYEITKGKLDKENCIIATSKWKRIYFSEETKLILRVEDVQDTNVYRHYKNIKVNSVTDEDVKIPDDIIIQDIYNLE